MNRNLPQGQRVRVLDGSFKGMIGHVEGRSQASDFDVDVVLRSSDGQRITLGFSVGELQVLPGRPRAR